MRGTGTANDKECLRHVQFTSAAGSIVCFPSSNLQCFLHDLSDTSPPPPPPSPSSSSSSPSPHPPPPTPPPSSPSSSSSSSSSSN